jgi:hypothetical protein
LFKSSSADLLALLVDEDEDEDDDDDDESELVEVEELSVLCFFFFFALAGRLEHSPATRRAKSIQRGGLIGRASKAMKTSNRTERQRHRTAAEKLHPEDESR